MRPRTPDLTWGNQTLDTIGAPGAPAAPPVDGPELPPRYEDRGRLGAGAIGEVRRVYDRVLDATFAMKILRQGPHAESRARFVAEARVTARLRHPGIVAVQDLGELPDGRLWFTMEEVEGRTLWELLHDRSGGLRRRMDVFQRICEAVAYAHARGVVHRDLKPDNVMVGRFGEVRVMDWGLAREAPGPGAELPRADPEARLVLGTPGYMPPEQAAGRSADVGPDADVYALGAILYAILTGERPYGHLGAQETMAALLRGPPSPAAMLAPRAPPSLLALCERAMARAPGDRPPDAQALAEVVRDWLEGARKDAEAREMVATALAAQPAVDRLFAQAEEVAADAAARLDTVPAFAPVADKLPGWRREEEAAEATRAALRMEDKLHRELRAALGQAPELDEAHEALADLYRARLARAEALGEQLAAADAEALLREHDRGRHARWLEGDGAVTVVTDPAGAQVDLYRFVERDRRLVEVFERTLGETPIVEASIPRGSWMLRISHPAAVVVRYPVVVGRLEHWDGIRPGSDAPHPIWLPPALPDDDVYVPAGWFSSGGDPEALDALRPRRLWVDGLVVKRHPVTNAEYRAYLEALLAAGGDVGAALPRGLMEAEALFRQVGDRFELGTSERRALRAAEPVVFVTAEQADAYAAWRARRDALPWRLPHDQEWEKAARGVDGRVFPWGRRFEPTWARMQASLAGQPGRADVGDPPEDIGPYGVSGMAGNVRDHCHNPYQRGGLPADEAVIRADPAHPDEPFRMIRGGLWSGAERQCRLATRVAAPPRVGFSVVGMRLFRSTG